MFLRKNNKVNEKILNLLREDCKMPVKQIGKKLNMPITTVHNRIKKMEREGIIKRYSAVIDYKKLGKPIQAFVNISLSNSPLKSVVYFANTDENATCCRIFYKTRLCSLLGSL